MNFCKHCDADIDHPAPCHGTNCPAYDGPQSAPDGFDELRERVDAIADGIAWLLDNAAMKQRFMQDGGGGLRPDHCQEGERRELLRRLKADR